VAGVDAAWDMANTENDCEMEKLVEERNVHRMAKVYDFVEMWKGSRILHTTQKESCTQNKQLTAVRYISDLQEIVKAPWSLFKYEGAAAFKLSEGSPLRPALPAKDLPGEPTHILNVCQIRTINRHPVESNDESTPVSILNTEDWLNRNGN
jgi:hypothetical protein